MSTISGQRSLFLSRLFLKHWPETDYISSSGNPFTLSFYLGCAKKVFRMMNQRDTFFAHPMSNLMANRMD